MGYYPPRGEWKRVDPAEVGMDATRLEAALAFAEVRESAWPRSMLTDDDQYIGTAYVSEPPPWSGATPSGST